MKNRKAKHQPVSTARPTATPPTRKPQIRPIISTLPSNFVLVPSALCSLSTTHLPVVVCGPCVCVSVVCVVSLCLWLWLVCRRRRLSDLSALPNPFFHPSSPSFLLILSPFLPSPPHPIHLDLTSTSSSGLWLTSTTSALHLPLSRA